MPFAGAKAQAITRLLGSSLTCERAEVVPLSGFTRRAADVARELIGMTLVRVTVEASRRYMILETEAWGMTLRPTHLRGGPLAQTLCSDRSGAFRFLAVTSFVLRGRHPATNISTRPSKDRPVLPS